MKTQTFQRTALMLRYMLLGVFFLCLQPMASFGQDVEIRPLKMSPFKIVLNAQGKSDDFQGIIPMSLGAYQLGDYEVDLLFNGEYVASAESFRYCYIDDNFLAGFDREEVLNSPVTQSYANETIEATVEGWFVAEASDGTYVIRYFTGSDDVEILDPGKR